MELSFEELREKEVININTGKKLGHVVDMIFDITKAEVRGIVVPGDKKLFKKSEDIFVSVRQIRRIGDDVILVSIEDEGYFESAHRNKNNWQESCKETEKNQRALCKTYKKAGSFIRYRRISNNKLN